jgi:hypothetical protein
MMQKKFFVTQIRILLLVGSFAVTRGVVLAQETQVFLLSKSLPLIGSNSVPTDLPVLFNKLLGISVGFAAGLAVIMLSIGGFKYMTSESMFSMGSAKEQITNAVVGLLIVLSAVIVLSYINPELVSLQFFQEG